MATSNTKPAGDSLPPGWQFLEQKQPSSEESDGVTAPVAGSFKAVRFNGAVHIEQHAETVAQLAACCEAYDRFQAGRSAST